MTEALDDLVVAEARVEDIMRTVRFLYPDEQYPHDETTIRALIVQGGTDAQIKESIAISAINMRVDRESKTRYAAGVLRNLMHPSPRWVPDEDDPDAYPDFEDGHPQDEVPYQHERRIETVWPWSKNR